MWTRTPRTPPTRASGQRRLGRGHVGLAGADHDGCAFVEPREDLFAEPTGTLPGAAQISGPTSSGRSSESRTTRSIARSRMPGGPIDRAPGYRRRPPARRGATRCLGAGWRLRAVRRFRSPAADRDHHPRPRPAGCRRGDPGRAKGFIEAVLAWRHSYGEDPEARVAAEEATRRLSPCCSTPSAPAAMARGRRHQPALGGRT